VGGPTNFDAIFAIANPNKTAAAVTIKVRKANGSSLGTIQATLAGNNQTKYNLQSPLLGLHFSSFTSTAFVGSVEVCSSEPIGLQTIRATRKHRVHRQPADCRCTPSADHVSAAC
jgi:hypothetical protein